MAGHEKWCGGGEEGLLCDTGMSHDYYKRCREKKGADSKWEEIKQKSEKVPTRLSISTGIVSSAAAVSYNMETISEAAEKERPLQYQQVPDSSIVLGVPRIV